jgi:hypothetical protein
MILKSKQSRDKRKFAVNDTIYYTDTYIISFQTNSVTCGSDLSPLGLISFHSHIRRMLKNWNLVYLQIWQEHRMLGVMIHVSDVRKAKRGVKNKM